MKINTSTFWESRANEIAYYIKRLDLGAHKLWFMLRSPKDVVKEPRFGGLAYRDNGIEASAFSRNIQVVTFDYSDDRSIKYLIDLGILIKDKTIEYGSINNGESLIKPPTSTTPRLYASYPNWEVLNKYKFSQGELNNSVSHPGVKEDDSLLKLTLVDTTLVLNIGTDHYPLVKMRYGSENYYIVSYLIANPNKDVTDEEIKMKFNLKVIKPFPKTLDNTHIKGLLRDAFFISANKKIRLNNPIMLSKLRQTGITLEAIIPVEKVH